jgi:hypothetical protein
MHLPEHRLECPGPRLVELTELRVLIPVGLALLVLAPEELPCDPLPLQLLVDRGPRRDRTQRGQWRPRARKQSRVDGRVIQRWGQGPRQPGRPEADEVRVDGALGEREHRRDLPLAAALVQREAQDLAHLSHRDPLSRHCLAPDGSPEEAAPTVGSRASAHDVRPLVAKTTHRLRAEWVIGLDRND